MARLTHNKVTEPGLLLLAGVLMTLLVQAALAFGNPAFGEDQAGPKPPQSWSLEELTTMELGPLPDIDWLPIESGTAKNSETVFDEGDNVVVVWQAGPAKLIMNEPTTYDEFVLVLKGELILTDAAGNAATYKTGDMFTVPKGFVGTWDMTEEYRELILVDTEAYNAEF